MAINMQIFINDMLKWIENNLGAELDIETIAKKSGYSRFHIQRLFKLHAGLTIAQYIRMRRVTEAAIALRFTDRKIMDIALDYGFDSQQVFTRIFKKQLKTTPGELRRSKQLNNKRLCHSLYMPTMPQKIPTGPPNAHKHS
ncbi:MULTISPECIES: helix-turn-helix domain-containing protein [Serratia]|jgi:AraC-like DNA-binding protein|uniref:helix-turn-helix domain-containing protein n=1 Tax=Serratia TaxID=613 RepID=UPI0021570C52|nr:helix-turn-helix domain-containing protein [Serratia liquefaciens]MDU4176136.1 helix-turn-helix domain-containing protein [Serratia liquefaciens]CAI1959292.1 right oriC-binding transcriptional activator [Serratia liquefaciens]HCT7987343.1 helix-turn-helix domain-containing protein [Serratia liquefaciens]